MSATPTPTGSLASLLERLSSSLPGATKVTTTAPTAPAKAPIPPGGSRFEPSGVVENPEGRYVPQPDGSLLDTATGNVRVDGVWFNERGEAWDGTKWAAPAEPEPAGRFGATGDPILFGRGQVAEQGGYEYDEDSGYYIHPDSGQIYDPESDRYYDAQGKQVQGVPDELMKARGARATSQGYTFNQATGLYTDKFGNIYDPSADRYYDSQGKLVQQAKPDQEKDKEPRSAPKPKTFGRRQPGPPVGMLQPGGSAAKVPSPEEFLDDFRTGFSTYLKGLRNVGASARQWGMENMDLFLGDYLGALGQKAAAGEQVFKAVGGGGPVGGGGQQEGVVRAISPLEYLQKNISAGALTLRYEGFRGARAARSRAAGDVGSLRRVGG